jgi:hypothetical protein
VTFGITYLEIPVIARSHSSEIYSVATKQSNPVKRLLRRAADKLLVTALLAMTKN